MTIRREAESSATDDGNGAISNEVDNHGSGATGYDDDDDDDDDDDND